MLNIWFSACIILSWLIMFRLHEQFSACTISLQHSAEFQAQLHKINWIVKHISFIFILNTQVHYTEGTIAIANPSFRRGITHNKSNLYTELHTEDIQMPFTARMRLHNTSFCSGITHNTSGLTTEFSNSFSSDYIYHYTEALQSRASHHGKVK